MDAPSNRFVLERSIVPAEVPTDLVRAVEEFRKDLREGYGVELPLGADSGLNEPD